VADFAGSERVVVGARTRRTFGARVRRENRTYIERFSIETARRGAVLRVSTYMHGDSRLHRLAPGPVIRAVRFQVEVEVGVQPRQVQSERGQVMRRSCCVGPMRLRPADVMPPEQVSEAEGEFSERGSQPVPRIGCGGDVVMPAAEVLHERVPARDGPGRGLSLQPEHRSEPGFKSAMIGLDSVVTVLLGVVALWELARPTLVDMPQLDRW
jgi:hypothetical protein